MTRQTAGRLGLAASAVSVALTFAIAVAGPSIMEPVLPGPGSQPPWSLTARPSPYLMIALTAVALAAGTAGLGLTIGAVRRGWSVPPRLILAAGIITAVALALVPPFGSSDHLSYAAYGRMVVTGHNPYMTTPAALAQLGDPVARAVQDWRTSPSAYGSLATGGQALASWIGGTSVRLTVFVLSLLNVTAFAVTGLLLHRLARGDRARQLRAAVLWTFNPLLLQVLVSGAHVDSQAVVFGIGALAVFALRIRNGRPAAGPGRQFTAATGAGALIGLGFAVKLTMALAGAGLALACVLAWRAQQPAAGAEGDGARPPDRGRGGRAGWGGLGRWPEQGRLLGGLALGFAVVAGASIAVWGPSALSPTLHAGSYVSIGSPWRVVRTVLRLAVGEGTAEDLVKAASVVLGAVLLVLLARAVRRAAPAAPDGGGSAEVPVVPTVPAAAARPGDEQSGTAVPTELATVMVLAVAFAWLLAWPYVLPWYDSLGWALLALLPWSRLDWLLLARTSALAFGYLPARGIALPAGLGWLETVVRTAVTPVILLAILVVLVRMLLRGRGSTPSTTGVTDPSGRAHGRASRLTS
ncbi:MAG: polyprenol phosphomannose-dependent alpha 1,6 mannosyltransferase MptB [Actinomycetota bacterium]